MILNKQISLWLSKEMYERLQKASDHCGISISGIIRGAISKEVDYILKHEWK